MELWQISRPARKRIWPKLTKEEEDRARFGQCKKPASAAASAIAKQGLACPDAGTLAILDTGEQALLHAHAICTACSIGSKTLRGTQSRRSREARRRLAQLSGRDEG